MQHGAVMHYNASTMRRHHQTVAVYNTYDYVVKHERNTVLLCGNRSTTYYVLFSHRATCDYVVKHERNTVLLCGNRSTTYYVLFSHRATCC